MFNIPYNGLRERVVKSSSSSATIYYYDEAGHITGEYDDRGNVLEETVYLGNIPIAALGGDSDNDWGSHYQRSFGFNSQDIHYIGTDNLGAPHTITDSHGRKVWEWHHTPFGDSQPQENGFTYNLRFPGQIYGPESGLNYNMFRDYNPGTGRYMQSDPVGLMGGINTYGYVADNPLWASDPLGLFNPVKGSVGFFNSVFGGALFITGSATLISGIIIEFSTDGLGTPLTLSSFNWAYIQYAAGLLRLVAGVQQLQQAIDEPTTASSWGNYLGLLPLGNLIDDPQRLQKSGRDRSKLRAQLLSHKALAVVKKKV